MSSVKKLILILVIAAVVIGAGVFAAHKLEDRLQTAPEGAGTAPSIGDSPLNDDSESTFSILYNSQKYNYNTDLKNYLLIGVDSSDTITDMTAESEDLCDFILLVSVDQSTGACKMIQLNRDSMVDVVVYDEDGNAGTVYEQLAYAHSSYTASEEEKCEATVDTVSNLLYNIPIDNYIAINMGGLPALVDLVDGVTLTIRYDFSQTGTALAQYAVGDTATLDGSTALTYVRTRQQVGDTTNADRMIRQQDFMAALSEKLRDRYSENSAFGLEAYGAVADYLVTDCSVDELMDFADRLASADTSQIAIPEGENDTSGTYTEFYLDEDALQQLIVADFFVPAA